VQSGNGAHEKGKKQMPYYELLGREDLIGAADLMGAEYYGYMPFIGAAPGAPIAPYGPAPTMAPPAWRGGPQLTPGSAQAIIAQKLGTSGVAAVNREPSKGRTYALGLDSVTAVAAGATATISSRPQVVFRPDRLVVAASIAPSFVITDLKVGKNSQLASATNLPAEVFSQTSFDVKLKLDTCQVAMDVVVLVTNISGGGARFLGAVVGPAVE
jgi:hypothetical protein